ncbi:MAG: alpha/beta hydrolase [Pseudomonadota bacterium]
MNLTSPGRRQSRQLDLRYDASTDSHLDWFEPRDIARDAPTILFFYGGSWQFGARQDYRFVAARLTALGYRVVIPDYRLFPATTFPGFVEDGARAFRWTQARINAEGGNPARIYLMGHSAGAQIAALLHYDAGYLGDKAGDADSNTRPPAGLIGLSGPYDFLPLTREDLQPVFPEAVREASQPIRFAGSPAPPALLLHGAADRTVGPGNAKRLTRTARAGGNEVTLKLYERVGHVGLLLALTRPLGWLAPVVDDVAQFIGSTGTPGP